jgi:hypothetical protein
MEYGVDIGDAVPLFAASLKVAETEKRFILDEFYVGDAFVFAMTMYTKSREFDG